MALGNFLKALATVLEVPVDLLEWLAVHPKHRHAVIEQLVVQAAKVGEIEWEPGAVVAVPKTQMCGVSCDERF